jgi:diguanylate cyclase (GGDEF)-like protein
VLVDFAQTVASVVRGTDLVARYGGEEFVLVLTRGGVQGVGAASVLARLRGQWSLRHPTITWSAGASCHQPGEDPHSTLREADRALYRAKDEGRDRVVVASSARELVGIATPVA